MTSPYVIAVMAPLVMFSLYRRFRQNFGRQQIHLRRLWFRLGILLLSALMFLSLGFLKPMVGVGVLIGLAIGAGLGWWGLRLAVFERNANGFFYTSNAYLSLALSAVLLARLAYRFATLSTTDQTAGGHPMANLTPFTIALVATLIGYYLYFNMGLLMKSLAKDEIKSI